MGRHLAFILLLHILWNSTEGGNGDEALVLQFTQPDYTVYIYENSPAKTYVEGPPKMGIYMREPSREIRYRIDSGDHENIFKAEEYVLGRFCFLRIRTKGGSSATLNREVRDRYVLTVKAQEQLSSGEVQSVVTVQVLDINDLRPLFSPTSYTVSLPENTAVRTNIGKVMATDADVGKNAEHYFSFKEWTDVFSIHPTSGIITLTGTLDYEGTASYEMDVLVVDRGLRLYRNGDVAGSARLTVRVLPANDHAPVITAVTLSTWDTGEDPTYAVVSVQDGDRGRNGEIASLSIVDGDPQQHFRVIKTGAGSNEYKIKGAKEVEWRGRPRGFNLTLRARDWGSPPRYSSAEVVRVHPPQAYTEATEFEESCYRVGISEFAPPNSFVVMVRTRPRRSPPKYTLKSATDEHLGLFSINPSTGLITTAGAIKADQTRKYELDVMTNDGQAATKVIVEVIDENNNAPRFGEAAYNASVDENVPVGTSVLAVSASDLDDGENGAVTYSIVGGRPSPFAINHLTGVISSAASLDYELRHGPFLFRVRASDCGSPFRRETETTVSVTVNNLNDNRPLFENNDCHLTVPRSLALGEVITVVSAVDADDLGGIRYEIKDGDALGLFGLVPDSGVLFLKKPLSAGEAAEVPSHAVEVTANDGEYSSPPLFLNITAVAGLHLVHLKCVEAAISGAAGWTLFESAEGQEDVTEATGDVHSTNRHAPQFVDSSPGVTEVKENIPVGTEFFCLRATDADTGFNGRLVFVISEGNQDSCFSIDMDTGCLKIIEGLDREKSDNHILNITVYDLGIPQKSASYVLTVIVLDINDNRPVFLQNKYSVEVSENSALGMEIVQVEAKVKNLRLNGMIRYRFLTVTNQLHIDENTGVVTVKGPLDREATPSLALKVSACNGGTGEPQQTSTVQLEVLLKDINDNSPAFFQPYYFVKVPEDVPLGTVVVWPEAQDPDLGPSGQVRYSLMEDGAGSFKIDKISGALRIAQNLDFEKRQVYNLTALVKDKGKPASLSSSCYIVVEVVDVDENFHRPSFPFFTASGSVSEDVLLGTTVLKVVASDHDSGRDGEIRYSTRGGSGVGVFAINEDSGAIYTKELLDYETMDHYWLIIYATDQGVVPLSTSIEVYIEVQDVNDNAPQTTEPVYYSSVYENSPKDTTVIQIEAVDPDTRTSEKLSYKITSGNPQGFFTIDPDSGLVTTTSRKLDREKQEEHVLEITVTDDVSPTKSTIVSVIVNVVDENDNSPQFLENIYKIKLPERNKAPKRQPIYRVIAKDDDESPYAEISYSIDDGDKRGKFLIEPQTGVVSSKEAFSAGEYYILSVGNAGDTFVIDPLLGIISVAKELDHWRRNQFELTIKASDKGDPSLGMETTVHIVVTMPDNSKPKFPHGEIVVEISEAAPVGTFVSLVTASSQSLVLYQIKEGNVDGSFTINPHSGVIATLRLLDRETTQSYKLIIQATNMADTASNITVYVHLKDENDNAPVFTETEFFGIISESAAAKSVVLTKENTPLVICAADADADLNGRLVYEIADPLARNYFQLDSVTGAIRTLFSLDFEQIAVFHFTVQVHDSGFPRLFGENTVNVTIQIMDYNDCPPKFSQNLYETNLFVPSYSGQKVISLNATDEDSPPNTKLLFSISDGNTGGKFRIDSSSGDIFVQNSAVLRSRYKLTVRVSDGRFASTAVVRVTAKHNQDQGPVQFTQKVYTASVRENSAESQTLALVSTVGRKMNEHLFYTILNQDRGFKIGRTSGLLFTTGIPFDREVQDMYDVLVGVTRESASPNILAHVLVKVTVEDVNDNPPVFVSLPYHALVQMDAEVGQVVRLVTAVDRDISRSAEIEYLLPDHDYFQVTSFGEISLKKSFEPQMLNAKFTISIVAQDKGEPSLSSTAEVVITVVNKATPVFEKLFYNIEIPENIPLHTSILQVHVSDSVGPKALYSIFEGDPLGHFFINLNSGVISVFHALDYEAHPAYKLRVRAMDSSTTAYSEVFVDIILQDVNDNAPVFEASLYNISLSESTAVGTAVLQVRALDSDFGTNREVLYQLLEQGGSVSPYFGIDQDTGVIVTTSFLDYETIPQHRLIIRAMDGGSPALSSEVSVIVHMSDINDNFPVFVQSHYRAAISELASQGQFVMCVRAFDVDTSDYYKLEYSFLSGNEQRHFSVDRKSGVIKILNHQRSKMEPLYNLTLAVTDGVFRSSAEVTVTVIRENLHSPSFAQKEYYIELVENSPIGTLVTEVKAIDSDAGLYGQVTYFIVNEVAIDKFTINADGQIYTAESFDRESPNEQSIFINVMAKDGGGKIGFCTVNVNLLDINDNAPQFHVSVYNGSIPWNVPKGFSVMKVKAVDRDEGRNGDIVYETYCEACHFEIHPLSGVLTTKASLFGFENFLFSFYVKAQDSGKPPKQSIVPVNIRVLPSHVSFLEVAMPMLTLEIPENLPVGTAIEAIQTDRKQFVTYSLVKGNTLESNQNDVFVVDSSTGKLKVSKRLDYETTEMFALTLLVKQNREGAELISSLNVKILLKDINDNSPQFDSDPYKSFVVENLPGGTSIIQLRATDLDAGLNGQVTYSLDEDQERADILELFAIESSTGWLTTVEELDWEKNERYSVSVVATDRGQEVQMMAKTRVDITVVDTNDNPPRFTQDIYRSEVREDDPVSTVITVLSATDPDSEETNRNISCYITGGDPLTRFGVEYIQNEWMVILRKPLDREERNNYLLNITATDGTHVVNTAVEIKVLDANDNSPVCEKALYVAAVPEDAPAGRVILRVSATDADSHANAEVSYWLSGDGAEHFSLEPVTGALKTLLPLDREERSKFELTAHAQDGGGRACQAGVVVTVDDINDNPPLFAPPYGSRFTVAENTEPGTYVAQIQATDPDSGMNGKVLYSLENSAGGLFSIHQQSGIMSLMKPLHKRAQDSYTLTVRATDQGSPQPRSTLGFLVVDVESAADSPPAFERRGYVVTVPEDITVGSRILSVSAVSTVVEKRPEISYCITGGNERGSFSIRSHTGDIFVIVGLDYETSHEHYLTVKATVAGKRALSDVATVRVNVTDVNDNSPVFSQRVYSAGVGEHATAGMVVLTVSADREDADGPSNSRVHFSIISGNQGGSFIIDATSGELRVGRQLDREKISVHTLKVLASDGGNPPRSSSAKIHIDVLDVNDNPPVFCQTNYSLVIQENLPIGSSVLQLSASDSDGPLNGPPFSFALQQGSNSDSFSIKTNGTLVTTQHLSHRVQEHHVLRIQVADSGRPPLSSSTVISIMVVAQSAHPPTVLPLEVLVSTPGEQYTGRVLGRVHASDQDIHDTLTYSLLPPSQSHFSISSSDGRLLARQSLAVGHYPLNVSVSDGHFTTATRVNVHVRQVTQQMLNQSVAVRFAHVSPEEFINERWHDVQRAIRIITGVRRGDVQLVSIQPVEPAGSLDVLVALERGPPGLQESLLHKLNSIARIQQITGLHIVRVVKNRCASAVCPTNFCREVVTLDETSISAYSGAKFSFVSLQHNTSAICLCQGKILQRSVTVPLPDWAGLNWHLRKHCSLKIEPNSVILNWQIVNARLQYRVVCGGDGRSITAVHRAQVDDGQWHSVSLGLDGNRAKLTLDRVHVASDVMLGKACSPKLGDVIFLGGHRHLASHRGRRSLPAIASLRGCLEAVELNGQTLALSSQAQSGAMVEDVEDVSPGCTMLPPMACSSNPCLNGGMCVPRSSGVCQCRPGFAGETCLSDVDECVEDPCLNGGRCINTYGTFNCSCAVDFIGTLCEIKAVGRNAIVPTTWSRTLEGILGILLVSFSIPPLSTVLLFLTCRKIACESHKSIQEPEQHQPNQASVHVSCAEVTRVPVRPGACASSMPGSLLSSPGRGSGGGSAAAEQPEISRLLIQARCWSSAGPWLCAA
uniref:FAT atypical cadherin 1 n=1 Tax=Denticeps clupeoides TaxID=299321 RepID=A0AAY4C8E6_9TELE